MRINVLPGRIPQHLHLVVNWGNLFFDRQGDRPSLHRRKHAGQYLGPWETLPPLLWNRIKIVGSRSAQTEEKIKNKKYGKFAESNSSESVTMHILLLLSLRPRICYRRVQLKMFWAGLKTDMP